ncbi:hypothetical protein PVL29_015968 [Vitis rotundifolia]|uniref:Uncharacterized protein n=1 Tax=Vitis rotundifolia TaxID=103349 RepID=A0AA38ZE13_VITRO|nr:hypothetical protein PVL29_015968 [Vitis rotundifolia]
MAKQEEEPVMGIPYPAVYHPNQNLYQAGVIPPNTFVGHPRAFRFSRPFSKTLSLLSTASTAAAPALTAFRFDDTQIAWNLLACPVTSANM